MSAHRPVWKNVYWQLWQPDLDRLVDASGGDNIDQFLGLGCYASVTICPIRCRTRRRLPTPCECGDEMVMCVDGLHTSPR